jgi:mRNA interferase MazF
LKVKRGDLVTIAAPGDYGKPRPALIVQADAFDVHPSVTVLPLTSEIHDVPLFRITVFPGKDTGLQKMSQIMVDKAITVSRAKIGPRMGRVHPATMQAVNHALRGFLGL